MKYLIVLWLLGLPPSAQAAKWALLIEVGTYPAGRASLSTDRDAYWMTQTLRQQAFSIKALPNDAATAQGIRQAIDALIGRCRPGDRVVIHYGGHGTQLPDQPDGDERDDHLDEALVPYDAPLRTAHNYTQSDRFIRDDELGLYLDRLRRAVSPTGHVLTLIDACHSGTLSRGQARLRTDNLIDNSAPPQPEPAAQSSWFELPPASLRSAVPTGTVVMITGAEASQKQYELRDDDNQWVGAVALCFSEAMALIDEQTTYQSLFRQMNEAMRRRDAMQNPTIDGNAMARLLGGDLVLPSLLTRVKLLAGQRFRQLRGRLLGYTAGSTVHVSVDRSDGSAPLALTGRVVEATPFESIIELPLPTTLPDSITVRTNLLTEALPPVVARVTLTGLDQHPQGRDLIAALQNLPDVKLVTNGADWLIRPIGSAVALCQASDGEPVEQFKEDVVTNLPNRLLAHAQAKALRDLTMHNSAMQATMTLTPARFIPGTDSLLTLLPPQFRNGLPVFSTDQQAQFEVRNTGTVPFYWSLIDIQPDAAVAVPLPNTKYPVTTLRLLPDERCTLPVLRISPPFGLETYKLLLARTPVNLRTLVQSRGGRVDGAAPTHPLVQLLTGRFRNSPNQALPPEEVGLADLRFWIDDVIQKP